MKNEFYENVRIKDKTNKNLGAKKKSNFEGVKFKKSLGQNFLSDKNLLNKIAEYAEVGSDDNVLEIGAGAGTLTQVLAEKAGRVISYEIDRTLSERLNALEEKYKNLKVVFDDFMNVDLDDVFQNEKFKVVANIPYYITTPIIFKLMKVSERISTMIFMVQKEVADRFVSKENSKDYGITSVILQSVADVSLKRVVKKECFTPIPKVDSALIEIKINLNKFEIEDYDGFCNFVHKAFSMRRKTLINNLIKNYKINKEKIILNLKKLNYNENVRPEQVSVGNFIELFKNLNI